MFLRVCKYIDKLHVCSAVQCSSVQCSAVQCSAVQCPLATTRASIAPLGCIPYPQCSAVQCSAVQCSAVQFSAVQCSAHPPADNWTCPPGHRLYHIFWAIQFRAIQSFSGVTFVLLIQSSKKAKVIISFDSYACSPVLDLLILSLVFWDCRLPEIRLTGKFEALLYRTEKVGSFFIQVFQGGHYVRRACQGLEGSY
jgi:hypothetical protein